MSDPTVSERRIRPIQDAIATENWKQALQLCDKWSKKGEKSDRFLALKAFVLVNQLDKNQHERGQAEVLELCKRHPPVSDPETIYQLQEALKCLSLEEEGPKLWERAVTAKQNDKDLYMRWLNQAILDNNWLSAQKATMGLRKSFPRDRNYEFWNILMCFLIHMQRDLPEKDRMLFGTLAYRMISKAAETIPTDQQKEGQGPGKSISTPEEVALLVQVLNSTGRSAEAVKLLQGDSVGMESTAGKKDPQLVLSLLLESMKLSEQWDQARSWSHGLLSQPEYQSDNRIWHLWLEAQSRLSPDGLDKESQELLDSACNVRPPVRAAYMAKMQYFRSHRGENDLDALLQTCKEYAQAFCQQAFCFDDLKESLRHLDQTRFNDFTASCPEQGNLAQVFRLKLVYSSFSTDVSRKDLVDFASRALQLYQSSLADTTGSGCPEAVVLAILALLKLAAATGETRYTFFAVVLLQIARARFEDFYLFSILLVQLQAYLGLLSLAMDTFTRLSVKNLQWETVGHLILTRISSLHLEGSGLEENHFEPLGELGTGLIILENADSALVRGIREGLRFNSYSNIHNSVEMRADIERSVNRLIYAIEERRLRRFLQMSEETVLPTSSGPLSLVDKRDFAFLPSYRPDDAQLLERFRCGPLPHEKWIAVMALGDNLATYLKAELLSQTALASKAFENLSVSQTNVERLTKDGLETELTTAEKASFECHQILARIVVLAKEGAEHEQLTELLEKLESWLNARILKRRNNRDRPSSGSGSTLAGTGIEIPTWETLHTSLTELETLQIIAMALAVLAAAANKKSKSKSKTSVAVARDTLVKLQKLVVDMEDTIRQEARDLKDQVNAPGVLGKLVDLGLARDEDSELAGLADVLNKLCDEITMETICGRIKDSWDDALDGVLAVKVKSYL
ncbi:hypothetical protein HRR83_008499 [Exophiala dermatitidis]|uniref:Uncharacterized protein n=2 Tax=Exophiala dermatitidis TaxID=5970 RepID=A0AAN6EL93_EXODE|nr:hypothetical protein HRR73_008314 [Exophiala dermatitidis]KAJ4506430.1 hypothetical protein HRR74_008328 [Exophiala dermatitidis]KAJ4533605.1 hypothetical protein HRR77_008368 [Exophiala dermatitidis]KAJ4547461.1 hypothetical protein HRR76_000103 [Exophiala dermatitidis]KAJ4560344.1 hypothetical protein HRR79_008032 [Exophiala dermatitidis]